jgi:DNA-binding CsgD family transcriptional regulator
MDLKNKTILVALSDPAWFVGAKLKQAGARVLLTDSLAAGQQMLHGVDAALDALVVGLRLSDGFCGPLIREARAGPLPCETLACVTDLANEAFLIRPALMEGPWDFIELPREASRLIRAVQSTAQRTQLLRRWLHASSGHDGARQKDAPRMRRKRLDTGRRIMAAAQALAAPEQVTEGELEMLRELAAGHSPAEIANKTGKSPDTVRCQLRSVRLKTNTRSLASLLAAVFNRAFRDASVGTEPPVSPPESSMRSPKLVKRN